MTKKYKSNKEQLQIDTIESAMRERLLFERNLLHNTAAAHQGKVTVYIGEVKRSLALLPNECVDCVVTSPPYWRQRDYKHPEQIGQEHSYEEYINNLVKVFTELKRVLKPTGTFFLNVGYKYQDKELLLIPELLAIALQKNGWALLNKIIWHKPNAMPASLQSRFSNVYEPVFIFVKSESKYNYYLSIDELRLPSGNFSNNKRAEEILGLEVKDSLLKAGEIKGYVSKVYQGDRGTIIAQIDWENQSSTFEVVQDFDKESQIEIELVCEKCGRTIRHEIDLTLHQQCHSFPQPILPPVINIDNKIELKPTFLFPLSFTKQNYQGKFAHSPDNRGASPGARKSLFGEYLVRQRRFKVYQPVIADYLRYWREKSGISTKEIDKILGYRDTAGHWFRKDTGRWGRGGSVPLPEDWQKLKEILKFDNIYDRWVTETHLVLQTVKPHPRGKNPGDVWSIKLQPLPEAHFATFPEELVSRCIKAGCPRGGVVLDPFAGSGTTGKVAQDLGHNVILIELVPEYLNIIKRRCKNVTEIIYVK